MGRRFLAIAVSVFLLGSCAVAPPPKKVSTVEALPKNPCFDPIYVELMEKPVAEMTEREYQIFLEKERMCAAYRQADLETKPKRDRNTIYGIAVGGILALGALGLIIANGE